MANTTVAFGGLLVLLGVAGYFGSGAASPTALIPAAFGLILLLLGALARHEGRRKVAMHIAVVVGLVGFLGSVGGLRDFGLYLGGGDIARPIAAIAKSLMALLCGIFVMLCVKSFVDARRTRKV